MDNSDSRDDTLDPKYDENPENLESEKNADGNADKRSGSRSLERKDNGDREENRGNRVFVGNLSFKTSWQKLKDYMRDIGEVVRVHIFEDRDRRSKGCGLVEFATREEALKAIQRYHETNLDGRQIYVREDNPDMAKFDHENQRSKRNERSRRSGSRGNSRSRSRSRERRRRHDRSRSRSHTRREREKSRRSRSRSHSRERRHRSRSRSRSHSRDRGGRSRDGFEIIVKNIPWSVTWQQLKDAFREFGSIVRSDIPKDRQGRSVGYGFVRFEREKDALIAIDNMDGATFNGRKIVVKLNDRH